MDPSSASPNPLEENWVTLSDLCRSQKVGYRTGLQWIKSKKLLAVMVGGRWRIYETELRRFLTEGSARRG